MPFYEYECSACKFYVEALQKISDPPMRKCPSCKKSTMKKLVSAPAFRLAGGGWYETDFKSDKENKRNLVGEDKDSGSSESKDESKTDSKADSKADAPKDTKPSEAKPAAKGDGGEKSAPRRKKSPQKPKPKAKPVAKKSK